ncbi:unnamed protein product [Caretta caretta]
MEQSQKGTDTALLRTFCYTAALGLPYSSTPTELRRRSEVTQLTYWKRCKCQPDNNLFLCTTSNCFAFTVYTTKTTCTGITAAHLKLVSPLMLLDKMALKRNVTKQPRLLQNQEHWKFI